MTFPGHAGARPRRRRAGPAPILLRIFSVLAILFAFVAILLVLVSGSWTYNTGDGRRRIGLVDLSIVQFDGIVPNKNLGGENYLVKIHWFLNSFGWEYPSAEDGSLSAGLLFTGPANTLRLPQHLNDVADRVGLDPSQHACAPSWSDPHPEISTSPCVNNAFFQKFRYYTAGNSTHMAHTIVAFLFMLYDLLLLSFVLAKEAVVAFKKPWLRCRCLVFSSSTCSCPTGSDAEIDSLPPEFWDRYRFWRHLHAFVAVLASATCASVYGGLAVGFLRGRGVGSARLGGGFAGLMWSSVGAVLAGCVVIQVSKRMNDRAAREGQIRDLERSQREEEEEQGRLRRQQQQMYQQLLRAGESGDSFGGVAMPPPPYTRPENGKKRDGDREEEEEEEGRDKVFTTVQF